MKLKSMMKELEYWYRRKRLVKKKGMSYDFSFTPTIVRYLQSIERVQEVVRLTILPQVISELLHLQAHICSTHYSTRIDGNRLTLKETGWQPPML